MTLDEARIREEQKARTLRRAAFVASFKKGEAPGPGSLVAHGGNGAELDRRLEAHSGVAPGVHGTIDNKVEPPHAHETDDEYQLRMAAGELARLLAPETDVKRAAKLAWDAVKQMAEADGNFASRICLAAADNALAHLTKQEADGADGADLEMRFALAGQVAGHLQVIRDDVFKGREPEDDELTALVDVQGIGEVLEHDARFGDFLRGLSGDTDEQADLWLKGARQRAERAQQAYERTLPFPGWAKPSEAPCTGRLWQGWSAYRFTEEGRMYPYVWWLAWTLWAQVWDEKRFTPAVQTSLLRAVHRSHADPARTSRRNGDGSVTIQVARHDQAILYPEDSEPGAVGVVAEHVVDYLLSKKHAGKLAKAFVYLANAGFIEYQRWHVGIPVKERAKTALVLQLPALTELAAELGMQGGHLKAALDAGQSLTLADPQNGTVQSGLWTVEYVRSSRNRKGAVNLYFGPAMMQGFNTARQGSTLTPLPPTHKAPLVGSRQSWGAQNVFWGLVFLPALRMDAMDAVQRGGRWHLPLAWWRKNCTAAGVPEKYAEALRDAYLAEGVLVAKGPGSLYGLGPAYEAQERILIKGGERSDRKSFGGRKRSRLAERADGRYVKSKAKR